MALQLTGAAKPSSIANLQLRMPIAVIGGGLTAIDTATESLAYYVVQVEKFLERYEALAADKGEDAVRAGTPPGGAESGEGRQHDHPGAVENLARGCGQSPRVGRQAETLREPVEQRAGREHAPVERMADLADAAARIRRGPSHRRE